MTPHAATSVEIADNNHEAGTEPPCRVWLRPVGVQCKVRVEGIEQAHRLQRLLPDQFRDAAHVDTPKSSWTILMVPLSTRNRFAQLERALQSTRGVELMLDPA